MNTSKIKKPASPYIMAIVNVAKFIRSDENEKAKLTGKNIDAFRASEILAIAFCKDKIEIVHDIMNVV